MVRSYFGADLPVFKCHDEEIRKKTDLL